MVRLVLFRGYWCAAETIAGQTKRRSLRTRDRAVAERRLADLQRKPDTAEIAEAAEAHLKRNAAKASASSMKHAWKALEPTFSSLRVDQITPELCALYRGRRIRQGVKDGTVIKELSFLRSAVKRTAQGHLARFELPPQPPPRDRWLTEPEFGVLLAHIVDSHLRLFALLAVTTAARSGALLDLTWDRVDFERRQIALGAPQEGRKARAVVPMNQTAEAALRDAHSVRTSDYVIEYAGKQVGSVKKGFRAAAMLAGLPDVSPHVLRHTAATWMAQKGVPMVEIARFLGHSDPKITFRVYAKHTPDYLRSAASAVEVQGGFFRATEPYPVNTGGTKGQKGPRGKTGKPRKLPV